MAGGILVSKIVQLTCARLRPCLSSYDILCGGPCRLKTNTTGVLPSFSFVKLTVLQTLHSYSAAKPQTIKPCTSAAGAPPPDTQSSCHNSLRSRLARKAEQQQFKRLEAEWLQKTKHIQASISALRVVLRC
eukprot:1159833-Pelagomonas_calceolata.AAC.5